MNRRAFLAATSAIAGGSLFIGRNGTYAQDKTAGQLPKSIFESERVPTLAELIEQKGTASPKPEEVEKAKQILEKCPSKLNPLQIAQYFQDLRQGEHDESFGEGANLYASEWPVRANPVIVSFFDATTLRKPNGDQTPWCAAFVNWCLDKGREGREDADKLLKTTQSAASATFRDWGTLTKDPKPGDIVVFQHKRVEWRGHVGFFIGRSGSSIYVLGGNQMPVRAQLPDGTYERRNTGEVNIARMPVNGRDLKLHSYRTDASLHDIVEPVAEPVATADTPGSQR